MVTLPDSRLRDPKATVMVDWPMADGSSVRLELEPVFCFLCGRGPQGYTPMDVVSNVSWLCQACSESCGEEMSKHDTADRDFWRKVHGAMVDRYGRGLTQGELEALAVSGRMPYELRLLERESPYRRTTGDGLVGG